MLLKCLCDQLFFATQQDFLFLLLCAYSDSKQLPKAIEEVKRTFLPTWLMDCSLWPMVNFVGFAMVPYTLQPTYMACVQFFWQIYLSSVAAKEESSVKKFDALSDAKKSLKAPHSECSSRLVPISRSNEDTNQAENYWCPQDAQHSSRAYVFNALRSTFQPDFCSSSLLASRKHEMPLKPSARTALRRYSEFQSFTCPRASVHTQDTRCENEVSYALRSSGMGLSLLAATAVMRNILYKI